MTLVQYGQAATITAIMVLTGNTVWAQTGERQGTIPFTAYFTMKAECCKDGKCGKAGDCCCKNQKCDAKHTCGKDNKCECKDGGESCCAKSGKCCKETKCSCPFLSKLAKRTALIMVMPASLPLPACCLEAMGMLPHPPLPPPPHVFLPPMPAPILPSPPVVNAPPVVNVNEVNTSTGILGLTPAGSSVFACSIPAPAIATKVRITAAPSSDQLEISVGEETCIRCKKMTVQIGDNAIRVSRFEGRIRVRGEDLKATADCVRTEGKDKLILEGDVVMHSKKNGRSTHVTGDCIEMSLSSTAMTIQRTAKPAVTPALHYEK